MTTGFVLIAVGHIHYAQLAINLATSIRYNLPGALIHIIYDEMTAAIIDHPFFKYFNSSELISGRKPFELKCSLFEISPFDRTFYLDVDTILFPGSPIIEFMKSLEGKDIEMINIPSSTCIWADVEDIRQVAGNKESDLVHYFSELIYFEKNEKVERYFNSVKNHYEKCVITKRMIANQVPDELAFLIASLELRMFPSYTNWSPLFWHLRNKKDSALRTHQLAKKYIGLSIGGNTIPEYVRAHYDNMLMYYEKATGGRGLKRCVDKRLILHDRIKL